MVGHSRFANGVLLYESVDIRNGRRMRIKIEGTIFQMVLSDITNVEGFKMESGDSNRGDSFLLTKQWFRISYCNL